MKRIRAVASFSTLGMAAFFLLAGSAWAQGETNPPPPPGESTNAPKTGDQTPDVKTQVTPTPAYPVDAQIHAPGRAMPLVGAGGPLHYGPIYLASIDLIGVYDQFTPTIDPQVEDTRLSILRGTIVLAKNFKKNLLLVEYSPQLAVLNGQFRGGADGSQALSIGEVFNISPRISISVKDSFGYTHTRQLFPDQFLEVDRDTGGVAQAYFIENSGTHLENNFEVVFNYKLTPRLLLTLSPTYTYSDTHYIQGTYIVDDSKNIASLTYALSARTNIGVLQSVELLHPLGNATLNNGLFRTTAGFYSEQITPTFWITGKFGLEGASYPGFTGTTWAAAGSFEALKVFSHSDLAVAYQRASTLTTYAGDRQNEQGDINYGYRFTKRFKWTNGIGYFHQLGGEPRISGKYAISTFEYHLAGGFSFLASYSRRNQNSSTPQLISGDRNTYTLGIRWTPAGVPGH
ncbi:MAG TPA: hypothetical protein VEH49_10200 [Methylomirabilota bacterium]|nr:hypothetical protein [Methylomirabilota bacterium]